MWSYHDLIGNDNGNVEILANSRKSAEAEFYKLNRPYIIGMENGQPIYNPEGGFVCECVITYKEWLNEGSPEKL